MKPTLLCAAFFAFACGVDVNETQSAQQALSSKGERCTADSLKAGWECCDDDQLNCTKDGPVMCRNHLLEPLTVTECKRIASDPRRPELATYGNFCATNSSGFLWCQAARVIQQ